MITKSEYDRLLLKKNTYRDKFFNLRFEMEMNKRDQEKYSLLLEKVKVLKKEYARTLFLIKEYEMENTIVRKRGRK